MTGTCDCGRQLRGGRQQCRQCAIEADAQATAPVAESAVERYEFAPACADCGEATYLGEWLLESGERAPNGAADEGARYFCPECQPTHLAVRWSA